MQEIARHVTRSSAARFGISLFAALSIAALLIWSAATLGRCRSRVENFVIQGSALHGVMYGGQEVFADYGYYRCQTIVRGDIVLYESTLHGMLLPEIVKAVPGDRWSLEKVEGGHSLLVNGAVLRNSFDVPYVLNEDKTNLLRLYEQDYRGIIPEGAYLLMSNLPQGIMDGTEFGLVSGREVRARIFASKEEISRP